MKKLMLLSLVIISANLTGYSLEEQLCSAVNNCDVKKTKDLISKIGEVNPELKSVLIKSAQNNIEHYQNASKFMLLSPRDAKSFVVNGIVLAAGIKALDFYNRNRKTQDAFEKPILRILDLVESTFKYFKPQRILSPKSNFLTKLDETKNAIQHPENLYFLKNLSSKEINDIKLVSCAIGISTAVIASLISTYKIINSINCKSASNKLNKAEVVYSLVYEIKVKEIKS